MGIVTTVTVFPIYSVSVLLSFMNERSARIRIYRKNGSISSHCHRRKGIPVREKQIEQKLIRAVRRCGGLALKLVSPGFNGVPDRLLLFMESKAAFCEVKAPGEKPRPLQEHRMEQLREMGFKVFVIDGEEQIGRMIDEIQKS